MRTNNLANGAARHFEVGGVYVEVLTNAIGTFELVPFQTFRVRATGATTVTIEGTLAATMTSGEIMVFNAGDNQTGTSVVTVTIAGANAFVQKVAQ